MTRPIESKDVVRIKTEGREFTGVVNRIDGENVNVFVTEFSSKRKDFKIGIWFNLDECKRIGKVR